MTTTITKIYDNHSDAEAAVHNLEAAGLPASDISIVANNSGDWYGRDKTTSRTVEDSTDNAAKGAGIGAGVGGAAGLLAGLGMLAIPGIGPVVAAGWLAATGLGLAAGATAGGIVGALTDAGVSNEDAPLYAEGLRRGGTLVSARVNDADKVRYEAILNQAAVDVRERSLAWKQSGWQSYDPAGQPYSADDIRRERGL